MKNPRCGPVNHIGGFSRLSGPFGQGFKDHFLAPEGEGDPAGKEAGGGFFIPGAIFMVAHQRETPAGKLNPDLMAATGMEPNVNQ